MKEIKDFEAEAKTRMKWITYKGKEILIDDYSNIMPEQFPPLIKKITSLTFKSGKKDILLVVDVTGAYANKEAVSAFNESGKKSKVLLKKTAVIGITGVKKIFLNIVNKFTELNAKAFSTTEEAKEWLVK